MKSDEHVDSKSLTRAEKLSDKIIEDFYEFAKDASKIYKDCPSRFLSDSLTIANIFCSRVLFILQCKIVGNDEEKLKFVNILADKLCTSIKNDFLYIHKIEDEGIH